MIRSVNRHYWDTVAQRVDAEGHLLGGDDTPYLRRKSRLVRAAIARLPIRGKSVLEVGSGPGSNLQVIRENAAHVEGCDVSPAMAELAQRTGVPVTVIDGERLPFEDGSFDVVFSCTVLQHNPDTRALALLAEMRRVANEHVFLLEDIGDRGELTHDYFLRPPSFYGALDVKPIGVGASDLLHRFIHAAGATGIPKRAEGEPFPKLLMAVEAALLPVTRIIDRIVPQRRGLAVMRAK
jgi:SAM-dependent methyltransferase